MKPALAVLFLFSNFGFTSSALAVSKQGPTPTAHQTFVGTSDELSGSRIWRAPVYTDQKQILGWTENAFAVPAELRGRVDFWKDIYTKYTTHQGVIHNIDKIDKVYATVDFTDIDGNDKLTSKEKSALRGQRVDDAKDKAIQAGADKDQIRFQLGLKDRMEQAIYVSGRYIEEMEEIFQAEGIPKELTRIVFVESSFNILARSKVGASGLWQIMPYTARPYGYLKDKNIDLRNHPMKATKLAASMLRDNFEMLKDWQLAVTGYNHGPSGVRRLTEKYQSRELFELIQLVNAHKTFGFASKNFYASFLAALEVEKNAPLYFKKVVWAKPFDKKAITLKQVVTYDRVLSWFQGDEYKLQVYNPHLVMSKVKTGSKLNTHTEIKVPTERYTAAIIDLALRSQPTSNKRSLASADEKDKKPRKGSDKEN